MLQPFSRFLDVSRSFAGRMRDEPASAEVASTWAPNLRRAVRRSWRDSGALCRSSRKSLEPSGSGAFAAWLPGAALAPVNHRLDGAQIESILADVDPCVLVFGSRTRCTSSNDRIRRARSGRD